MPGATAAWALFSELFPRRKTRRCGRRPGSSPGRYNTPSSQREAKGYGRGSAARRAGGWVGAFWRGRRSTSRRRCSKTRTRTCRSCGRSPSFSIRPSCSGCIGGSADCSAGSSVRSSRTRSHAATGGILRSITSSSYCRGGLPCCEGLGTLGSFSWGTVLPLAGLLRPRWIYGFCGRYSASSEGFAWRKSLGLPLFGRSFKQDSTPPKTAWFCR